MVCTWCAAHYIPSPTVTVIIPIPMEQYVCVLSDDLCVRLCYSSVLFKCVISGGFRKGLIMGLAPPQFCLAPKDKISPWAKGLSFLVKFSK